MPRGTTIPAIKYLCGNADLFDDVKPLWEALNEHHLRFSENFKQL